MRFFISNRPGEKKILKGICNIFRRVTYYKRDCCSQFIVISYQQQLLMLNCEEAGRQKHILQGKLQMWHHIAFGRNPVFPL